MSDAVLSDPVATDSLRHRVSWGYSPRQRAQQAKVAAAEALAFVAPIQFCNFLSILKGWIDRVCTLDLAFGMTSAGWRGDVSGRIPLLHHKPSS